MSVSRALRFKILKRDDWTCQYCGKRQPDVTLEVDHVFPASKGGRDTVDNLVTGCYDCNQGKRAELLANKMPAVKLVNAEYVNDLHQYAVRAMAEKIFATLVECSRHIEQTFGIRSVSSVFSIDYMGETIVKEPNRAVEAVFSDALGQLQDSYVLTCDEAWLWVSLSEGASGLTWPDISHVLDNFPRNPATTPFVAVNVWEAFTAVSRG